MDNTSFSRDINFLTGDLLPNETAMFKDFYLSYNNTDVSFYGSDTTAIVLKERVFFLLNGDHRQALLTKAKQDGLQGCVDYFIANIALVNKISEHGMVIGISPDRFDLLETALEVLGQDNINRIAYAVSGPTATTLIH